MLTLSSPLNSCKPPMPSPIPPHRAQLTTSLPFFKTARNAPTRRSAFHSKTRRFPLSASLAKAHPSHGKKDKSKLSSPSELTSSSRPLSSLLTTILIMLSTSQLTCLSAALDGPSFKTAPTGATAPRVSAPSHGTNTGLVIHRRNSNSTASFACSAPRAFTSSASATSLFASHVKGMLRNPGAQPNAAINRWIATILVYDFKLVHVAADKHRDPTVSQDANPPQAKKKTTPKTGSTTRSHSAPGW